MGAMPLFLLVRYRAGKMYGRNEMEPECDGNNGAFGDGNTGLTRGVILVHAD